MSRTLLSKIKDADLLRTYINNGLFNLSEENKNIPLNYSLSMTEKMNSYLSSDSNTTAETNVISQMLGISDPFKRKMVTLTDAVRKFAYVPKKLEVLRVRKLRTALLTVAIAEIDTIFPFRNDVDQTLIRYGMKDYCKDHATWRKDVFFVIGLDSVLALNLVMASKYIDKRYEWLILRLNAFYGVDVYIDVAKSVSNFLKSNTVSLDIRRKFLELQNLAGYRTLPFGGFDLIKETDLLATGGQKREIAGVKVVEFVSGVMDVLVDSLPTKVDDNPEPKESFLEYIRSGRWITSGASSIGKVTWELDDETGHFKAKKNNVPYLYTAEELYKIVMRELGKQVNIAITKEETAKIRVAVAGDFPNYIAMAWLFYLLDEDWKLFPSIDSGVNSRIDTNKIQVESLKTAPYTLPFDFAGFDRQISTDEMSTVFVTYVSRAVKVVKNCSDAEVLQIIELTRLGFYNSVILTRNPKTERPVVGGLPSGLRITAFLGAMWNLIINLLVVAINLILYGSAPSFLLVKGDDSDLHFSSYQDLVRHRFGFISLNMTASVGKFSAHYGETEFLRNWFTRKVVTAYAPRAMVSFTQRKTWSDEPYSFDNLTESSQIAARSVSRRVGDEEVFHKMQKLTLRVWTRSRKLPSWVSALPHSLSGPQLSAFKGVIPKGKFSYGRFDLQKLILNDVVKGSIAKEGYVLPAGVFSLQDTMITDMFKQSVAVNRINGLSANIINSVKKSTVIPKEIEMIDLNAPYISPVKSVPVYLDLEATKKHKFAYSQFQKYVQMSRYDNTIKVSELMRVYHPEFWNQVTFYEKRGAHRSTAIDITMRTMSEYNDTNISDQIISQVSSLASLFISSFFSSSFHRVRSADEIRMRATAWRYALSFRASFAVLESLTQY